MKSRHRILPLAVAVLLFGTVAVAQHPDNPGSKDPALFTRMPNFFIAESWDTQFDGYDFPIKKGKEDDTLRVEGHFLKIHYIFDDSRARSNRAPCRYSETIRRQPLRRAGRLCMMRLLTN
jgi:hypothetical protein